MSNSKAEIDQFLTGLSALGVLGAVKANPQLFETYFCIGHSSPPVAGRVLNTNRRIQFPILLNVYR